MKTLMVAVLAVLFAQTIHGHALELPQRLTERPQTTNTVPHIQLGVEIDQALADRLLQRVAEFPGVRLGPTRLSLPGAVGFLLDPGLSLARPDAIVGGLEFAHMHPDGSLHASLDPHHARAAVDAGWAVPHPWAQRRAGWEGFVVIYTPVTDAELAVVIQLLEHGYSYVTGTDLSR